MSLKPSSLALAMTGLVAFALPASAEDGAEDRTGTNVAPLAADAAPGGAATMGLAQDLFALGAAQGEALTVLAAARLAASVDVALAEPGALDPATVMFDEGDHATLRKTAAPAAEPAPIIDVATPRAAAKASFFSATSEAEGAADAPVTTDAMFATAMELAAGDDMMLSLIADAMADGSGGRIVGAVQWPSRLPAGMTEVWEVPFRSGSRAEVAVIGDGDANLDVAIIDENGNVICDDVSWSDRLTCDWTPAWDGYFHVTVQNMGGSRNSYHLITN